MIWTASHRQIKPVRSCQSDIVVIILASPVDHCAGIETVHPRIRRPVIVQTEIGSTPWETIRKKKQTRDTKMFAVR